MWRVDKNPAVCDIDPLSDRSVDARLMYVVESGNAFVAEPVRVLAVGAPAVDGAELYEPS